MNAVTPVDKADENWSRRDVAVEHAGKKIVLPIDPEKMGYKAARDALSRIEEQENQTFSVIEQVQGAPWDAVAAVYRAIQEIYGVVLSVSTWTFFGEKRPQLLSIKTGPGPDDQVQVPFGQMELPGVTKPIQIEMNAEGAVIAGTVRRADRERLVEIRNRAQSLLRTNSLYRGKAIRFSVDDNGDLSLDRQPDFIELTGVSEADMIHTRDTEALIQTNIFAPLKHTDACRRNRIPLKRGILLEGRYGTGKSLTARVTAKVATDNGWTFIMLDRAQGLRAAIEFAKNYQPCVIFAEDIDRCADRDDEGVNDLVNMLDGVISKQMEMMTVLTTNFIDKIDRALLRPGRFDAVISIQAPDPEAVVRLIHQYGRDLIEAGADLTEVGNVIAGQIPATIREVVERAKLAMLVEGRSKISGDDLYVSAIGMKHHIDLLAPKPAEKSVGDRLADDFRELFGVQTSSDAAAVVELANDVKRARNQISGVRQKVDMVGEAIEGVAGSASKAVDLGTSIKTTVNQIAETVG